MSAFTNSGHLFSEKSGNLIGSFRPEAVIELARQILLLQASIG